MKVGDLSQNIRQRVPFRLSEQLRVPETSGCYVLTNIDDDVLYVGQTLDLNRRAGEHFTDARMTAITREGPVSWFYWRLWPTGKIKQAETQLLVKFKYAEGRLPALNIAGP